MALVVHSTSSVSGQSRFDLEWQCTIVLHVASRRLIRHGETQAILELDNVKYLKFQSA